MAVTHAIAMRAVKLKNAVVDIHVIVEPKAAQWKKNVGEVISDITRLKVETWLKDVMAATHVGAMKVVRWRKAVGVT
jgi:hypothetical protein